MIEATKGQIISKGLLVSSNFPKKQMKEFVFTTMTNSFVRFMGEFEDIKKSFPESSSRIHGLFCVLEILFGIYFCVFVILSMITFRLSTFVRSSLQETREKLGT